MASDVTAPAVNQPDIGRRLTDIWIVWVVQHFARRPPGARPMCTMPYWTSARHRPIYWQEKRCTRFNTEGKVMRCPLDSQSQGVPWSPVRKCLEMRRKLLANTSQANCDWGIRVRTLYYKSTFVQCFITNITLVVVPYSNICQDATRVQRHIRVY